MALTGTALGLGVGLGIGGFIVLLVVCYCLRRKFCPPHYVELGETPLLTGNKLWVGLDPTDKREEYVAPSYVPVSDQKNRDYARRAGMFCRSLQHDRAMQKVLSYMGSRHEKFFCLIADTVLQKSQPPPPVVMTMIDLDARGPSGSKGGKRTRTYSQRLIHHFGKDQQRLLKQILLSLRHPYVLPTLDLEYGRDHRACFAARPFSIEGSLRDYIHQNKDPTRPYVEKYSQYSRSRGTRQTGRPIRIAQIATFGRQILEGLLYFQEIGFPYFHVHSGNVILINEASTCQLTDYENALFGLEPLHQSVLKDVMCADPQVAAFGLMLYEMATGTQMPPPLLTGSETELVIDDKRYRVVEDILHSIFFTKQPLTLKDLISHAFFRVQVKGHNYNEDTPDNILKQDAAQALLEPVFTHYDGLYRVQVPRDRSFDNRLKGGGSSKKLGEKKNKGTDSGSDGSSSESDSDEDNNNTKRKQAEKAKEKAKEKKKETAKKQEQKKRKDSRSDSDEHSDSGSESDNENEKARKPTPNKKKVAQRTEDDEEEEEEEEDEEREKPKPKPKAKEKEKALNNSPPVVAEEDEDLF